MAKKPAGQTSTNGTNGAGDAVNLEEELDGDNGSGSNTEDEDEDDDSDDGDSADIGDRIERAIAAALPQIQKGFQSEMDRRINSALNRTRKPAGKGGDNDEDEDSGNGRQAAAANVRGARIAFREYLPDSIRLLSSAERELANEFGQSLIQARAVRGFDDEDQVGQEVATATAEFLKKARDLYSSRTKRILQKQGALKDQDGGQSAHGGDRKPDGMADAYAAAEKKDRELHPERYVGK